MDIQIHIVAHERRRSMAESLAQKSGAESIWWDDGFHGEWRNHRRAWTSLAQSDATHGVVLQDDAVPIPNFREELAKAISRRPEDMISLYVGRHRPHREEVIRAVEGAERMGAGWIASTALHWGVGVVIPVPQIADVLSAAQGVRFPYDQRMGEAWMRLGHKRISYCWPSLVDHEDSETVAHKYVQEGVRKAHKVGPQYASDGEIWISPNIMGSVRDRVR